MPTTTTSVVNPYFSNPRIDYVYKAEIKAFGRSFGGIFIVKKVGSDHHRIVFITELGNKIFDFSFKEGAFKVNQIVNELNRKPLLKILKNDFEVLLRESSSVTRTFANDMTALFESGKGQRTYFYFVRQERLQEIVEAKNGKTKVSLQFLKASPERAEHIQISHHHLDLTILLKAI